MTLEELRDSPRAVITRAEAAIVLEVDERTVARAIEGGQIPAISVGRRVLIPRLRLLALLGAETTPTNSESASATDAPIANTEPERGAQHHGDTLRIA